MLKFSRVKEELVKLIADPARPCAPSAALQIRALLANAPFATEQRPVSEWNRIGPNLVGQPHPVTGQPVTADTVMSSAEWHALKHTALGEWRPGTTLNEYLADVRRALSHADAVLEIGKEVAARKPPRSKAASWVEATDQVLQHGVPRADHVVYSVYDAARNCIVTGFRPERGYVVTALRNWTNRRRLLP